MKIEKSKQIISAILLGATFLAAGCAGQANTPSSSASPSSPPPSSPRATSWPTPPPMSIDANKQYTAIMKTNYGDINIELFPKDAPLTVNSFVFLARQGFFDGVKFHRIIKGFMIQGGDPTGTGSGGPGYKFADEKITRDYLPGTLAMANSGPNTNGSQFFITLADLKTRLQKNYTIFGIVTKGFDIVEKIGSLAVVVNPNTRETSVPTVDVHINGVVIEEK